MKVRYKVTHIDEHGMFFPAGCVAEHDESEANKRIELGLADAVHGDAYSRILPPESSLQFECAPEIQTESHHPKRHEKKP